jgi:hypothetical protein
MSKSKDELVHASCGFTTSAADGLFGGFAIATLIPGGPAHAGGMVHVGDVITEVRMGFAVRVSFYLALYIPPTVSPSTTLFAINISPDICFFPFFLPFSHLHYTTKHPEHADADAEADAHVISIFPLPLNPLTPSRMIIAGNTGRGNACRWQYNQGGAPGMHKEHTTCKPLDCPRMYAVRQRECKCRCFHLALSSLLSRSPMFSESAPFVTQKPITTDMLSSPWSWFISPPPTVCDSLPLTRRLCWAEMTGPESPSRCSEGKRTFRTRSPSSAANLCASRGREREQEGRGGPVPRP